MGQIAPVGGPLHDPPTGLPLSTVILEENNAVETSGLMELLIYVRKV